MARKAQTQVPLNPLREFMDFAKDFTSIYALIAKVAVFAPLVDLVLNLGPPWPSRLFVSTALVMEQVIVLMISFAVWRQGRTSPTVVKRWLVGSFLVFSLLLLAGYIPLFATFIVDAPDAYHRVVIGDTLQEPIARFVQKQLESGEVWSAKRLLDYFRDGTNDETAIWTPGSVAKARALLLTVWIAVCTIYALGVSAFLALQYRRIR